MQVHLNIHHDSTSHPLVLSAEFPEIFSRQDYDDKVFGTYWPASRQAGGKPESNPMPNAARRAIPQFHRQGCRPATAPKTESRDAGPRSLHKAEAKADSKACRSRRRRRLWPAAHRFLPGRRPAALSSHLAGRQGQISGPLKMGESGGRITVFRGTPDAVVLRFSDFQPADRPGFSARALRFDKSERPSHLRQAYVRLTVDDQSDEFWMPCSSPDPAGKESLGHSASIAEEVRRRQGTPSGIELCAGVVPPGLFDPPPQGVAEAGSGDPPGLVLRQRDRPRAERSCGPILVGGFARQASRPNTRISW